MTLTGTDAQDSASAWLQKSMRPETEAEHLQRIANDYQKAKYLSTTHGGDWAVNGQWAFEPPKPSWSERIFGFDLGF